MLHNNCDTKDTPELSFPFKLHFTYYHGGGGNAWHTHGARGQSGRFLSFTFTWVLEIGLRFE